MRYRDRVLRVAFALPMLVPAILVGAVQFVFHRELEWDGVTRIYPAFSVAFAITSVVATHIVVARKPRYLMLLVAGPTLTWLVYLIDGGATDPSWFNLLALLTIGMLAGAPVTWLWMWMENAR